MIYLLLLASCAKQAAPVLYPTSLPELSPTPVAEFSPAEDECPESRPYLTGKPPPFTQLYGDTVIASCRAQVVPESQIIGLVNDADSALYWEPVARACYERSLADRIHGQANVDALFFEHQAATADARMMRLAVPAAFVGGVALGLGVGAAYSSVLSAGR